MTPMSNRLSTIAAAGLLCLFGDLGTADAAPQKDGTANRARFNRLLALRSRSARSDSALVRSRAASPTDPFSKAGIDNFNRRVIRQGRRPPPIAGPLDPSTAAFRRDYILALYRYRALRHGGTAGGVFFTPPSGTPYFPVKPLNIFTYFPVYRAT